MCGALPSCMVKSQSIAASKAGHPAVTSPNPKLHTGEQELNPKATTDYTVTVDSRAKNGMTPARLGIGLAVLLGAPRPIGTRFPKYDAKLSGQFPRRDVGFSVEA